MTQETADHVSMVKDSIKTTLAINGSATEDMKRAAAGSASVLDLMDKSSIASSNENLLAVRPIFAGDLLDQYRQEFGHRPHKTPSSKSI
ncbi:hypothetical protein BGX34_001582 [Mortierella sp. NVP85]|nr:hypothetical protein BGX34_001582 [Mortierella sp. NVP85]